MIKFIYRNDLQENLFNENLIAKS